MPLLSLDLAMELRREEDLSRMTFHPLTDLANGWTDGQYSTGAGGSPITEIYDSI